MSLNFLNEIKKELNTDNKKRDKIKKTNNIEVVRRVTVD